MNTLVQQTANGKTYHQRTGNRSGPAQDAAGHLRDHETTLNTTKSPANVDGQQHNVVAVHQSRHYHLRHGHADEQLIHEKRRYVETLIPMQMQTGLS